MWFCLWTFFLLVTYFITALTIMSHGIWLSKAPLSCFCCFFVFQPEVFWLFSPFYSFMSSLEPFHQVPGKSLLGTRLCSLHSQLTEPSPLPDEGQCYFPHTTAEMHRDGLLAHSCKAVALLHAPAPSSPRQHSGYTDKPETTKPGSSAESLAVHAVTLLRIPGDSRNHAGF